MATNNNILSIIDNTPDVIIQSVAAHVKDKRLAKNLTQQALASRAGITLPSYRRFERTGEISFRSLVMIGIVLDASDDFNELFTTKSYQSIEELTQQKTNATRKRGTVNE